MSSPHIQTELHDGLALVRLDRPPVNAMDLDTLLALADALEEAASRGRALVLTGREGAFSAGLDLKAVMSYDPERRARMVGAVDQLCRVIYTAPVPTVAAVSGHAIGGGMVLTLACDARIGAAVPSVYSLPEVRVGVHFPEGAMAVVRGELGPILARRMALCDQRLSAEEALANGILDALVPPERLLDEALATAARLAALPGGAFQATRRQLRAEAYALFERMGSGS